MLLYLFAHQYKTVLVGDACRESGAPRATALRYMKSLITLKLMEKDEMVGFQNTKRVRLTKLGRNAMQSYLESISILY
jgi:DNA-binding IclR family transcriptional regulator